MSELIKSDIFFFVATIGFSLVAIAIIIAIIYIIRAVNTFTSLLNRIDNEMDNLSGTALELLEDLRQSFIYRFIFNAGRKKLINKLKK